ncbi:hypothetical protein ACFWF7_36050 [Nocardia sp. NPDC060256]|uniref:hypothetical protein n=1 Tax=unclassified Nocardia TaxID=2637762 RepID=UPI003658FEC9
MTTPERVLTHVVLMKFHEQADAKQARELLSALDRAMPHIPALTVALDELDPLVSYGTYRTPRGLSQWTSIGVAGVGRAVRR